MLEIPTLTQHETEGFWKKLNGGGSPDVCWTLISNQRSPDGYHRYRFGAKSKTYLAHRISWSLTSGKIPSGLDVLHKCDNRGCVNPNHLFLGTHQDNMNDMKAKGRSVASRGNSKLTPAQVLQMRELRNQRGWTYRRIAEMFRVDERSASRAIRGITSHVRGKLLSGACAVQRANYEPTAKGKLSVPATQMPTH